MDTCHWNDWRNIMASMVSLELCRRDRFNVDDEQQGGGLDIYVAMSR